LAKGGVQIRSTTKAFKKVPVPQTGHFFDEKPTRSSEKAISQLNRQAVDWSTAVHLVDSNALIVCFWRDSPQWARASFLTRFLVHTQRRTTVDGTPLDEWSARSRDLYLTTHNNQNKQTSLARRDSNPVSVDERPQSYALDRTATGTGSTVIQKPKYVYDVESGGIITGRGKLKFLYKNLSQCNTVHHDPAWTTPKFNLSLRDKGQATNCTRTQVLT
jgi:hypothetical protein